MKKYFWPLFMLCSLSAFSQQDTGFVKIYEDPRVMLLDGKYKEVKERTDGETDGYRIKIFFSSERDKANAVRMSFMSKYPDVSSYENYAQPLFVILAGDFRTKLEAYKFYTEIKGDFPASFIIKDKIKLPPIKKSEVAEPGTDQKKPGGR